MKNFEAVVGLEVHAQLKTRSKIFCRCSTTFGAPPNTQVCPVCLGLPGALPVLNSRAVELALRVGLATGSRILPVSAFARKNYFYPDLPKGYQISQYDRPLCRGGEIMLPLKGGQRPLPLTRIHLEEDAGKSVHLHGADGDFSLLDFNRCGVPLIEIVSKPELRSPREAVACLEAIKQLLEYLDVCDGDMEKGALRCDVNVSVGRSTRNSTGTRTEIKNLNSYKNLEKALFFEIDRQVRLLTEGRVVTQQTLLWDEAKEVCAPMRSKEEAHDYRYFPEPDLAPIVISKELLRRIENDLPELPWKREKRFAQEYGIPSYDAKLLTSTKAMADYYEECVRAGAGSKAASNWIMTEVFRALKEIKTGMKGFPVGPTELAELLELMREGAASGVVAKAVFDEMLQTGERASTIIENRDLKQIKDTATIEKVVAEVLETEFEAAEQYLAGKERTLQFLVGQVMNAMSGRGDPRLIREVLKARLSLRNGRR